MSVQELGPLHTHLQSPAQLFMYFEQAPNGEQAGAAVEELQGHGLSPGVFAPGTHDNYGSRLTVSVPSGFEGGAPEAALTLRRLFPHRYINSTGIPLIKQYFDLGKLYLGANIRLVVGQEGQRELPTEEDLAAVRGLYGVARARLGPEAEPDLSLRPPPPLDILNVATTLENPDDLRDLAKQAATAARLFLFQPPESIAVSNASLPYLLPNNQLIAAQSGGQGKGKPVS